MAPIVDRLAGAPISWGVCEVPGWGVTLPPARVLGEMRKLGLRATELGPVGYLGAEGSEIRGLLESFGLQGVGGFVPLVLHDPSRRAATEEAAVAAARLLAGAGASRLVTAAVADEQWGQRPERDAEQWRHLCDGLALVEKIAADHGLVQVLHPHVGTLVENDEDVRAVLELSDVRWCLDTGHVTIGGIDPVAFATAHADRIGLVHLKDVRTEVAVRVRAGELSLLEGSKKGLFCALGRGDVAVGDVVEQLERAGYSGWYVLEQDVVVDPTSTDGPGPTDDVRASMDYLDRLQAQIITR